MADAEPAVFVHERAINESDAVGPGTRIWAFAHVMKGARVGADCNIGEGCFLEDGCVIGDGVTLKNGVSVWAGVTICDFAFVGPNAVFTNDRYPRSPRAPVARSRYADDSWCEPTRVGEGASIGANATILCGTRIGRYATVAAAALVTRDVADHVLVAGVPAKPRGDVCRCGQILAGDDTVCAACGSVYRRRDDGLEWVGDGES
jgi:acetyltransferase-like isoleucine patch superfamily enzyme